MKYSIGLIETAGFVTALACADRMIKSAYIEIHSINKVGSGMITVIIKGDLASVQHAIEIGREVAGEYGELIASRVIPRPYEGLEKLTATAEGGEQ
ncbi:BMC domain-containing protein [Bacillus sp. P14.5]|uniref:BMC domain-containing protein n=1 Tax=Bacillus sp. P14.5 TaxID=1983400 RepID=UPI000DEB754B|nr:BMC domain-containing protein [Bacillus sp. P14.5]